MDTQNLIWLLSLLFASILILQLLKECRKRATRKLLLPPGPWKLPIIGNLHQLGSMPHHSLRKLSQKHGPLMSLKLGSIPTLVISSSDIAREVFKAHDLAFSGRPPLYAAKKLSYGFSDMVFAPYGEYWRQVRRVCVLELLSLKRVQSFRAIRECEVASLIASIRRLVSSSSSSINLSELIFGLSNSITYRVIFGDKYAGNGSGNGVGRNKFHDIFEVTQELIGGFCVADFFPWLEWINAITGLKSRLQKNFEELDMFYSQVIEEHMTERSSGPEGEDLVHVLLRLQKEQTHGSTFSSMDCIKGVLTDIFIAGTDTSSAAIIWTMTELMRNATVLSKAQQELQMVVGEKTMVEEADLEQLVYLKLVIKESLRLHSPAPLLVPRETTESCNIRGYTIPSKTRVFINASAIATDPMNWEKPTDFWPERFTDSATDFREQDFDLIPFGIGRRGCPGVNFALLVVELTLANLLHCFDWELPTGMEVKDLDVEEAFGLTVHKKNPLCLVAKPR